MNIVRIKLDKTSGAMVPEYATKGSAGVDLRATEHIVIEPGEVELIPTGISIELPKHYEAQVRPRSGLALKHGITVLNSPGTIDSDYRGEIGVMLINHSKRSFVINPGDRIAQMVIARVEQCMFSVVPELGLTDRGDGGFGSTGVAETGIL